jgi:hypothetical protein
MKNHITILCLVLFTLITVNGLAQSNRSSKVPLFETLPKIINCTTADLNQFFTVAKGQTVKSGISNQLNFNGSVINSTKQFSNLHSMAIKLPDFKDAVFSISKRMDENNKPVFIGHIISQNSTDGYELKKTGEDTYQFVKINMEDILPTCAQQ